MAIWTGRTRKNRNRSRRKQQDRRRTQGRQTRVESLEARRLLAGDMAPNPADDLASLSDEFDQATTVSEWQRVYQEENWGADQLQVFDVNQTQPGRMVMQPATVVWYQSRRGPLAFKELQGDFVFTSEVHISDRDEIGDSDPDNIPDDAQFSLGGLMIRTPREINDPLTDWHPGTMQDDGTNLGENYVFLSLGHGTDGQMSLEVKTTRNSDSQLELTPAPDDHVTLQVARVGDSVITLYQFPGQPWTVHRRYQRADMPETIQVGLVSYTDWSKASDFEPFDHNSRQLGLGGSDPTPGEPFNPDLVAAFEYARYARPQTPAALEGVDLVNDATDEQLLAFLGDNANTPAPVDPPGEVPQVAIQAMGTLVEGEPSGASLVISRDAATDAALEVVYQVSGDAIAGDDYQPLSGTAVIPAGEESVVIPVQAIDDLLIEGTESIIAEIVDQVAYDVDTAIAELLVADDDFLSVDDVEMAQDQDTSQIVLPAAQPDGTPLSYTAGVVGSEAFDLDQLYDFYSTGDYHENWGGHQERWIRGDGDAWFYLLPGGGLHRWNSSFEDSTQIAELDSGVYDDPATLIDVVLPATVSVEANVLTIDPAENFIGQFEVDLSTSSPYVTRTQRFLVSVQNAAPTVQPIAAQTIQRGQLPLEISLQVSDADGDPLEVTAVVVQSEAYQLDQQHQFYSDGDDHLDWGGQNERWVRGDGNAWFYVLPTGDLHQWNGAFPSSPLIASLGTEVYDNLERLTDPEALPLQASVQDGVADGDFDLTIEGTNGEQLVAFAGSFAVLVEASDGHATTSTQFLVHVSNEAPQWEALGDLNLAAGASPWQVPLVADDPDGDPLQWTADLLGTLPMQLDAEYGLTTDGDFHTNWGGMQEKWLQGDGGQWFYLLADGAFYRWEGSFESSSLLATLDAGFYEDPHQLTDPEPLPITLEIDGDQLLITADEGFSGSFQIQIGLSDGLESLSQTILVTIG